MRLFNPTPQNPFLPYLLDLLQTPSPCHALLVRLLIRQFGKADVAEQKQLDRFLNLAIDQVLKEAQLIVFDSKTYKDHVLEIMTVSRPAQGGGLRSLGLRPVAVQPVAPAPSRVTNSAEAAAVLQLGLGEEGFQTALQV